MYPLRTSHRLVATVAAFAVSIGLGQIVAAAQEFVAVPHAAVGEVSAAFPGVQQQQRAPTGRELPRGEIEAMRREKGIESVARQLGHYKSATRLDKDVIALDLATIADKSDIVLRGTLVSSASSVSDDRTWIVTDYQIRVSEVFDGSAKPGDTVTLRLPGGRVQFDDGSVAEVSQFEFRGLELGREYVLFLSRSREAQGAARYELAWGTQGTFELTSQGIVQPLGTTRAQVPKSYASKSVPALLNDTRAAVLTKQKLRGRI
jgi:hypothetical protein